ncbi:MAG: AraC-like DNA-binding protein [Lysobacterales bacterium]
MSEKLKLQGEFDVLGDVLQTLRFRGSIFFNSDLAAPWGMSLEKQDALRFHIVLLGDCFVGASGQETVKAGSCDIVMLPNGGPHWIADKPGRKMTPSTRAGAACELGNPLFQKGTITNRLVCGMVHFDRNAPHPIMRELPEVMHFPMLESAESIWSVIKLIEAELSSHQGRSNHIADRLTEVLFMQLLDNHVQHNQDSTGFLAALRDRRVHHALTLIHQEPAFAWSLSTLGDRSGMSRATLVRRFNDVIGVSPMVYISDWRVMKANSLIRSTTLSLEQVANATGFASARTLSTAFKRHYGCTPGDLRRSQVKS